MGGGGGAPSLLLLLKFNKFTLTNFLELNFDALLHIAAISKEKEKNQDSQVVIIHFLWRIPPKAHDGGVTLSGQSKIFPL